MLSLIGIYFYDYFVMVLMLRLVLLVLLGLMIFLVVVVIVVVVLFLLCLVAEVFKGGVLYLLMGFLCSFLLHLTLLFLGCVPLMLHTLS